MQPAATLSMWALFQHADYVVQFGTQYPFPNVVRAKTDTGHTILVRHIGNGARISIVAGVFAITLFPTRNGKPSGFKISIFLIDNPVT
jgi:hypothetical protein